MNTTIPPTTMTLRFRREGRVTKWRVVCKDCGPLQWWTSKQAATKDASVHGKAEHVGALLLATRSA